MEGCPIHEKDDEWLKSVLKLECPSCESYLEHKGIKRACECCDFTAYGNPIFMAYKEEEPPKPKISKLKSGICPECFKEGKEFNFIIKDSKHAERICGECGLVLSGPPTSGIEYPWGNDYDYEGLFQ